jgi:hypothetical protein
MEKSLFHCVNCLLFTTFKKYCFRASAEEAVQRLHGTMIGQQAVRLSWGRSPASKQVYPIKKHLHKHTIISKLFL